MTDREIRRKRFLMLSAAALLFATVLLMYLLRSVLITVVFSALIAYVLLPLRDVVTRPMPWRERRPGLSRGIAVILIFVVAMGVVIGAVAVVVPPTIEQGEKLIDDLPTIINSARVTVEGWVGDYTDLVPAEIRTQVETSLANMGGIVFNAVWQVLPRTFGLVSGTFALIIGLGTMPVLVFYMTRDSGRIGAAVLAPFPKALRPYVVDMGKIVNRTAGGYLRGQFILALIVGVAATIGLLALGVPFAALLGVVAGATALIPIVGPFIGGAVALLVTLATAPDKLLWVAVLYLGVQLAENTLIAPRVQSGALNLHPIVVIIVIIVGSQFFGIWGIIFGPPLVSMFRDVVRYLACEWDASPVEVVPAAVEHEQDVTNDETPI